MKKVAVFGDSIFRGVMADSATKKYFFSKSIDWKSIEEKLDVKITNYSKMGATIKHGYSKLQKYLEDDSDTDTIVIEFGGNDSDFDWKEVACEPSKKHTSKTKLCDFERMLNSMLDLVIEKNIRPILATLPPIHSTRYFEWITRDGLDKESILSFLIDKEVLYRHQELFSNKVAEIAYKRSIELVDIRSKFLASRNFTSLICEDGVHMNEEGEKVIVQCFIEKFQILKEI